MHKKDLQRTPLYDIHRRYKAKMVPFAGWEMPVQYSGIIDEHKTVRTAAGLFDVSHMGEIFITGEKALEAVQLLITNDAAKVDVNQALYSPMCYEDGGVVDDLLVYKFSDRQFMLVVNAANREKDLQWMRERVGSLAEVEDRSGETSLLALQGPLAQTILQKLTPVDLDTLKYFWFTEGRVNGIDCVISRTGYTGEDGFELFVSGEQVVELWEALMTAGKELGLKPAGLGARDTLRLEASLPLYGHELSAEISPLQAGLKRFVKFDKETFIGKEALLKEYEEGVSQKLVGFEMVDRGIPRSRYLLFDIDGNELGIVSSGSFAPSLNKNIGLGFIKNIGMQPGDELMVGIRGKHLKARLVKRPFYARKK
ncbi:MAG: glycine cleavage system aminomethyltransferase GcvT [Peptococcaceae bacterium]|nr:glycine cleavage system aminomethyltransferase GcvT [Peptococcaceae bacterium]